jgi:methylglutaconyl-CoA hydratase
LFDTTEALDDAVDRFGQKLCTYNPKAMTEMKTMFWRGTEDWDQLLAQRAKVSGRLVLSEFTKEKLKGFK